MYVYVCSTVGSLSAMADIRIQDLTDNSKLTYAVIESILDSPDANLIELQHLVTTVRKLCGAVQTFSWDWTPPALALLFSPMGFGLRYFVLFLLTIVTVFEGGFAIDDSAQSFMIFSLFIMSACGLAFISTIHKLSKVGQANARLLRLLDFTLKERHTSDSEVMSLVGEMRYLLENHGDVKMMGYEINRPFMVEVLRNMFGTGSLIITGTLIVGAYAGAFVTSDSLNLGNASMYDVIP